MKRSFAFVAVGLVLITAPSAFAQPAGRSPGDSEVEQPQRGERPERGAPGERGVGERMGRPGSDEAGERGGPGGAGRFRPRNLLFEAIDLDGDGTISKVELRKAAVALKKLDVDNDGSITLAEASSDGESPRTDRGPGDGRLNRGGGDFQEMISKFMENDANGDGKLTSDEVPERLMPMLRGGDANGDKAIDAEELQKIFENQAARFGRGGGVGGGGVGGPLPGGAAGGRAQQMVAQMMRSDANGDGRLTPNEVPQRFHQMLQGADANKDGALDAGELTAAMQKMAGGAYGRGGAGRAPGAGQVPGAGRDPRGDGDPRQQGRDQQPNRGQ